MSDTGVGPKENQTKEYQLGKWCLDGFHNCIIYIICHIIVDNTGSGCILLPCEDPKPLFTNSCTVLLDFLFWHVRSLCVIDVLSDAHSHIQGKEVIVSKSFEERCVVFVANSLTRCGA